MKKKNKVGRPSNEELRRRRNKKLIPLFLLVLIIGIGYALLSSNLSLVGGLLVSGNNFDVHYTNVKVSEGSVEATKPKITGSTELDFEVILNKPGDFYEFTVDVVNSGTVDAMISGLETSGFEGETDLLLSSITWENGDEILENQILSVNEKDTILVRVEYNKDITGDDLDAAFQSNNKEVRVKMMSLDKKIEGSLSTPYIQEDETKSIPRHEFDGLCKRAETLHYVDYLVYDPDAHGVCIANIDSEFDMTKEEYYDYFIEKRAEEYQWIYEDAKWKVESEMLESGEYFEPDELEEQIEITVRKEIENYRINEACPYDSFKKAARQYYGSIVNGDHTLKSGDAFDCDVNGDGVYDSELERFYYVSDFYDGDTNTFDSSVGALIYSHNVVGTNINKPTSKNTQRDMSKLPTTSDWPNVSLYKTVRNAVTEIGTLTNKSGRVYQFNYSGKAARLLTYQEIIVACGEVENGYYYLSSRCPFMAEDSGAFQSRAAAGYWLESARSDTTGSYYGVIGSETLGKNLSYLSYNSTTWCGTRPVIDVLKTDLDY